MSVQDLLLHVIEWSDTGILVYFLWFNSFYAVLLLLSIPEVWQHWRIAHEEDVYRLIASEALPPVSILVPAYNEALTIVDSATALLTLEYPHYEVILVNDGSADDTMARLVEAFELYEVPPAFPARIRTQPVRAYYRSRTRARLVVIDKANGGKADALNAALNASRYPHVIAADADTLIEPDALPRLARPFRLGRAVAAVGGNVRVANGSVIRQGRVVDARVPRAFLPGVQTVEYLRAFLFGRMGWNRMGGNLIVSGAFGMFRKDHLLQIQGYRTDSVTEDLEVVVRLHDYLRRARIPYEVPFVPDPVAWTEVPATLHALGRQRERWHRGLIHTLVRHIRILGNPRHGRVGLIVVPFFFLGEMLAPLVEVIGYGMIALGTWLGVLNIEFGLLFFAVALGYGLLLSLWAVALEEITFRRYTRTGDLLRLLLYAIAEPFGYRQWTVLWRTAAFWRFLRGVRTWGERRRRGFHGLVLASTLVLSVPGTAAALQAEGPETRARLQSEFQRVTDSDDWWRYEIVLARLWPDGHRLEAAAGQESRFGTTDSGVRGLGVWHAGPRLWLAGEAGLAPDADVIPRWSLSLETVWAAPPAALGVGYRHVEYRPGAVNLVWLALTHEPGEPRSVGFDLRGFLSRNPSDRWDGAFLTRTSWQANGRLLAWLGYGYGRESFLVGPRQAQEIRSLRAHTVLAGARYGLDAKTVLRIDLDIVASRPRLSRQGAVVTLERRL